MVNTVENQILNLDPQAFNAALAELQLGAEREADLRRQYRRANSVFSPIYGLLDQISGGDEAAGRVRGNVVPMTRPQGMTGLEAIMGGQAELAVPGTLMDLIGAVPMAIDAPVAAYQGGIPAEDIVGEALSTAGLLNLGSLAGTAPRGALRSGAGRSSNSSGFDEYLARVNPQGSRIPAEARPNLMMGDMYGMLPDNAKRVRGRDGVQFYEADGDFYATAYNPDVGGMDVVGYAINRGDMTDLQVVGEMQGSGIGSELQYLYRRANPDALSGGLTEAGERSLRRTYDRLAQEGLLGKIGD